MHNNHFRKEDRVKTQYVWKMLVIYLESANFREQGFSLQVILAKHGNWSKAQIVNISAWMQKRGKNNSISFSGMGFLRSFLDGPFPLNFSFKFTLGWPSWYLITLGWATLLRLEQQLCPQY